uniref:Tetraspanin n=1 Tax=Callorhinchus milii TaxID=7868 RepID=A0A4W3HBH1_CALMI
MAVEGGMKCIKYLIFIFNFLFWVSGIALIVVGILVQTQMNGTFLISDSSASGAPIVIIVVGVVINFVAFFGCCGAWKENYCMVTTVREPGATYHNTAPLTYSDLDSYQLTPPPLQLHSPAPPPPLLFFAPSSARTFRSPSLFDRANGHLSSVFPPPSLRDQLCVSINPILREGGSPLDS